MGSGYKRLVERGTPRSKMQQTGIYYFSIAGTYYIGQAVNFGQRWKQHYDAIMSGKKSDGKMPFYAAVREYGWNHLQLKCVEGRSGGLTKDQVYNIKQYIVPTKIVSGKHGPDLKAALKEYYASEEYDLDLAEIAHIYRNHENVYNKSFGGSTSKEWYIVPSPDVWDDIQRSNHVYTVNQFTNPQVFARIVDGLKKGADAEIQLNLSQLIVGTGSAYNKAAQNIAKDLNIKPEELKRICPEFDLDDVKKLAGGDASLAYFAFYNYKNMYGSKDPNRPKMAEGLSKYIEARIAALRKVLKGKYLLILPVDFKINNKALVEGVVSMFYGQVIVPLVELLKVRITGSSKGSISFRNINVYDEMKNHIKINDNASFGNQFISIMFKTEGQPSNTRHNKSGTSKSLSEALAVAPVPRSSTDETRYVIGYCAALSFATVADSILTTSRESALLTASAKIARQQVTAKGENRKNGDQKPSNMKFDSSTDVLKIGDVETAWKPGENAVLPSILPARLTLRNNIHQAYKKLMPGFAAKTQAWNLYYHACWGYIWALLGKERLGITVNNLAWYRRKENKKGEIVERKIRGLPQHYLSLNDKANKYSKIQVWLYSTTKAGDKYPLYSSATELYNHLHRHG